MYFRAGHLELPEEASQCTWGRSVGEALESRCYSEICVEQEEDLLSGLLVSNTEWRWGAFLPALWAVTSYLQEIRKQD